jgi:hypothetical protein
MKNWKLWLLSLATFIMAILVALELSFVCIVMFS